jgi:uncharacterized protein (DUF58 family)
MITRSGWAVAAVTAVFLVAGILLDYAELVAVAVTGVLALVAAGWWVLRRPDMTAVREIVPGRVTEGDGAMGVLTVTNTGRHRSPPLMAFERVATRRVAVPLPGLASQAAFTVTYPLPTDRRGVFPVGPLTIARSDPLRLVLAADEHPSRSLLTVHPRIHAVEPLPTGRARDMDGPTTASSPQGGIAFHSLREYVPGDDRRLIHWRATARTGKLMVRHNVVPNEPRLMVVLDTSEYPYRPDSFEDAVRVAASLCIAACDGGFPARLRTTGGASVVCERGGSGRDMVLDLLAAVERGGDDGGLAALVHMVPEEQGVSLGVVTGQPQPQVLGAISAVRSRFDMVSVIMVGEEFARAAPAVDGAYVLNCTTSEDFAALWNGELRR